MPLDGVYVRSSTTKLELSIMSLRKMLVVVSQVYLLYLYITTKVYNTIVLSVDKLVPVVDQ
jgi:hypothetical protein